MRRLQPLAVRFFWCLILGTLACAAPAQLETGAAWPAVLGSAGNSGGSPGNGATNSLRWSYQMPDIVIGSAVVNNVNTVFVCSLNGFLYAFNGTTGAVEWSKQIGGGVKTAPAIGQNGVLYVADEGGVLHKLDGATGNPIWSYSTPSGKVIESSPTIGPSGQVFFGCDDGNLYCVNSFNGTLIWSVATGGTHLTGTPAFDSFGDVIYGTDQGHLAAYYDLNGQTQWLDTIWGPIEGSPVMGDDGNVYFGDASGDVVGVGSTNGNGAFLVNIAGSVTGSPAWGGPEFYLGSSDGNLDAFNSAINTADWSFSTGAPITTAPIVLPDGNVIVANTLGQVYEVDPLGHQVWKYSSPDEAATSYLAIGADGAIYFGTHAYHVYALDGETIAHFQVVPGSLTGGSSAKGVLQLNEFAGPQGANVSIVNSNADVQTPASLFIPPFVKGVSFNITTSPVSTTGFRNIGATVNGVTTSAQFQLDTAAISNFFVSPSTVVGGNATFGVVQLANKAGPSGDVVTITGGGSLVSYPPTVTVPAGGTGVSFPITTVPVSGGTSFNLTATLGSSTMQAPVALNVAPLTNFYTADTTLTGGTSTLGVVQLNGKAGPLGDGVTIQSSSSSVSVPGSVTVAVGTSGRSFLITTSPVSASTSVTLTAILYTTLHCTLVLNPYPIGKFYVSPAAVVGGTSTHGVVQLLGPAGPGGDVVSLQSSSSSATVPATVMVPAGMTGVSFLITTTAVSTTTPVTITATLGSSIQQTSMTLTP